ncbi:MAG: carboxypeptidase-like regulatory domain-containing protein [Gemmatimonadales bacterium]|nr:carboxypeptidase-like regulatory domain-containing protein [Candidatus Palauibacter irciniicola]MYC17562.1 carboxypeptidase-like regulatory domain-containing protein [Gemmatimonadales bacterium]
MARTRLRGRRPLVAGVSAILALGSSTVPLSGQGQDCDGRGILQMVVVDDSGTIPIPNATVIVQWTDADRARQPVRQEVGPAGNLALCAPRDARQATVWAEFGDASSQEAVVGIVPDATHEVELRLLVASATTGRLIGSVRDAGTERPVVAATVSVVGGTATTETNRRGSFVLSGVPVGVHELAVRHLGYAPLSHVVSVSRGITTEVDVGMVPDPVEMEPIVATATRPRRLEVGGFYERKYWGELVGGGTFFTATDIERRGPVLISQMIADEPGIRLGNCRLRRSSCILVNTRVASEFSPDGCPLSFYLDNTLVRGLGGRDGQTIDDLVRPHEIAGVEIYRNAASLPGEFAGSDSQCGIVAIWTK